VPVSGVTASRVGRAQVHHELSRLLGHGSGDWSLRAFPETAGDRPQLEIGVVGGDLDRRLPEVLRPGARLELTGLRATQVWSVAGPPERAMHSSWHDLATPFPEGKPVRSWDVVFMSPACTHPGAAYFPLLDGASLLQSLIGAWQRGVAQDWGPPAGQGLDAAGRYTVAVWSQYAEQPDRIPAGFLLAGRQWDRSARMDLRVSALRGHTEVHRIPQTGARRGIEIHGFVGSLRLVAADDDLAALADCLLRLGQYAGAGAKTGYGFGAMSVTPWRPPPPPT
jgi:hypothetical protein